MDIEKARQFLTNKGWEKTNSTVGGALFEGFAQLLAEYEAKVISDKSQNNQSPTIRKQDH